MNGIHLNGAAWVVVALLALALVALLARKRGPR
jgi:hypothetical protein